MLLDTAGQDRPHRNILKTQNNSILLTIIDNGVDIKKEQISHANSLGLLGIRERVEILSGELAISGSLDKGTRLDVRIPLEEKWLFPNKAG